MDKSSITPLDEKNYATWKIQVKMALIREDLWNIVNGTAAEPTEATALARYISRKDKALALIVLSIQPRLLYLIGDPQDPINVWKSLQDIFQKKSWSNKFRLKKQLYGMRLNNGDKLQEHLKKMMEIFDELSVIGDPQSDEDRVICLLSSLPDKFSTLVTALEANEKVPSWETVVDRLMHEDGKSDSNVSKNDNALISKSNKFNSTSNNRNWMNNVKCYACGRSGHIKKYCNRLKNKDVDKNSHHGYHNHANTAAQREEEDIAIYARNYSAVETEQLNKNLWIFDSGCTQHVCNDRSMFINFSAGNGTSKIEIGDGTPLVVGGKGDVIMQAVLPDKIQKLTLKNVLFVPDMNHNLISVSQCTSMNKQVMFYDKTCKIISNDNKLIACGSRVGKLYYIDCTSPSHANVANAHCTPDLWHRRLGHVCNGSLQKMVNQNLVRGLDNVKVNENEICHDCAAGKMHRSPFPIHDYSEPRKKFELIHSDVCGKLTPESVGGASYIVTFIDDATRYCWIYALKSKDEVFAKFKEWKIMIETQFETKIKNLKTDNGGEYCSNEFENFLKVHGIRHLKTIPKTPEQNGMAECKNRHLIETVRSMISDANVGKDLWGEAVTTANYIINRCYTRSLPNMTPYEALHGKKPSIGHLRVFGSRVHAHIPKDERTKLDFKSRNAILVGYGDNVKGYRLYDPSTKKIFYSRDVIFDESRQGGFEKESSSHDAAKQEVTTPVIHVTHEEENPSDTESTGDEELTPENESSESDDAEFYDSIISPDNEVIAPRQSTSGRMIRPPHRLGEWCSLATSSQEPTTVQEALHGPEAHLWLAAMNEEMDSMKENNVWKLVDLPKNANLIKCKWVFKRKLGSDGKVSNYRARLVARGYSQKYGIDFEETYSPVVRFESIRTILSIAAQRNLKVHSMDVSVAFLNSDLNENLYMSQPENFSVGNKHMVCKLNKAIYGLKQSSMCWYEEFSKTLKDMNFTQSETDQCVYTYFSDNLLCIIALYVDDLMLVCNSEDFLKSVKAKLQNKYKVKDLGIAKQFLGVNVHCRENSIFIEQTAFTENLLLKFGFHESKPISTPVDTSMKLGDHEDKSESFDKEIYQSAIGNLLYLSHRTRPDICFAVANVARYSSCPTRQHWQAVKRIFRYLRGTANYGIVYGMSEHPCFGYSDADFAGDLRDRKSTSGFCFLFGNAVISWKSTKQTCVALSTAESEYVALSTCAQEAIWLQKLLIDLKCYDRNKAMLIKEDNQSALSLSKNNKGHTRAKHIEIKYHFCREMINAGKIKVEYCPTADMLADIFTKGLPAERFSRLRLLLGMKPFVNPFAIEKE